MFNLTRVTTENLIAIAGIVLTAITIAVSILNFGKTIHHSLIEAKQQMALKRTSESPLQVSEFCSATSNLAAAMYKGEENLNPQQNQEYIVSKKIYDKLLPELNNTIYAYGSNNAIKVYKEFQKRMQSSEQNQIPVEVFYLLPLLLAQVKMDVTGVSANPIDFIDPLMPQFKEHCGKAKNYINKKIDELKLDDSLRAS